jgi:hypothetical protein
MKMNNNINARLTWVAKGSEQSQQRLSSGGLLTATCNKVVPLAALPQKGFL